MVISRRPRLCESKMTGLVEGSEIYRLTVPGCCCGLVVVTPCTMQPRRYMIITMNEQ